MRLKEDGFFKGLEEEHSPKQPAAPKDESAPVDVIAEWLQAQSPEKLAKWFKAKVPGRVSWKGFILLLVLLVLGFTAWFFRYEPLIQNHVIFLDRWTGRAVIPQIVDKSS
jgi:hypothetical protein